MTGGGARLLGRAAIESLMAELARRPSEFGPLYEREPAILAFITEEVGPRLAALGMGDQRIDAVGNLIARTGERRAGAGRLLLVANAMTQPAYDMPDAFLPRIAPGAPYGIEGDVMIARGLSEQKANLASVLSAVGAALADGPLTGELTVLCCPSGETGRHDAIAHAVEVEGVDADMAVLGGTSLTISLGNRGRIDLTLTTKGKTSHSSRPRDGANAALAACALVQRLVERGNEGGAHPDLGPATLTLTGLRSQPETTHTIQDRCIATLDRRLLPGEDPAAVTLRLREILDAEPYRDPFSDESVEASIEMGAFMYPSLVEEDAPVVRAIKRAAVAAIGEEPRTLYLQSAFDQGYLNHRGIPAVNFGCGEYAFAHTDDDLASIDRTIKAARTLARLIRDVTSVQRSDA